MTGRAVPMGRYRRLDKSLEPRIRHPLLQYVSDRLSRLQELVTLESDGQPIHADGFRLKSLTTWAAQPQSSLLDNFGSLSGFCNVRCSFCYEYGNALPYDLTMLGLEEARTRARYFDRERQTGLLHFTSRLDLEPFTNPWLIAILRELRRHDTEHFISLTTNGARLDEPMLSALAELAPVHLVVSINNQDPQKRRALMRDQRAELAIGAVRKLRSYGIPFTGSIVAWPETSDEDLTQTMRFYDECHARAIRVSLPSYSAQFSGGEVLFDTDVEWDRLFALVEREADILGTPLSAAPYLPRGAPIIPRVAGVIRNSPAARAGVRRGDVITQVDGVRVRSRMQCKRLLCQRASRTAGLLQVHVERDGVDQIFTLDDRLSSAEDHYPYKPAGYRAPSAGDDSYGSLFGVFMNDDLDPDDLLYVTEVARRRRARRVVVMTSRLVEGVVLQYFTQNPALIAETRDLELIVLSPRHDYWGGNIVVGDLYLCQDYVAALERLTAKLGYRPELVVIPSTFSPNHWTDLAGVPYSEIEMQTGIPVELVPCRRIVI